MQIMSLYQESSKTGVVPHAEQETKPGAEEFRNRNPAVEVLAKVTWKNHKVATATAAQVNEQLFKVYLLCSN